MKEKEEGKSEKRQRDSVAGEMPDGGSDTAGGSDIAGGDPRDTNIDRKIDAPDTARSEGGTDPDLTREIHRRSRRAFLIGGAAMLAGYGGWRLLRDSDRELGVPRPIRRMLDLNESVARGYYSGDHLARTYPASMARMPRVNGDLGLEGTIDPVAWRLQLYGLASQAPGALPALVTIEEIRSLPKVEHVTELRCIEGWSEVVRWGGARLGDLLERYPPASRAGASGSAANAAPNARLRAEDLLPYLSIATPDRGYYIGLDIESALHPQTLLCYEMNGRPLTPEHGAPLRLVTPVKYGIKNIKRIGTITFTARRPGDYWYERGYDWYAGL